MKQDPYTKCVLQVMGYDHLEENAYVPNNRVLTTLILQDQNRRRTLLLCHSMTKAHLKPFYHRVTHKNATFHLISNLAGESCYVFSSRDVNQVYRQDEKPL